MRLINADLYWDKLIARRNLNISAGLPAAYNSGINQAISILNGMEGVETTMNRNGMTEKEYNMPFGQWCIVTKGADLVLTEAGEIAYMDPQKAAYEELYHDLWMSERKAYRLQKKNEAIATALMAAHAEGIPCRLCSFENGHIQGRTKHGETISYYATTGTIAGYGGTNVEGLDEFIRLCKK